MADTVDSQPTGIVQNHSLKDRVWFITGASGGFGLLLTRYVLSLGGNVAAASRKPGKLSELQLNYPAQLQLIDLDVTSEDSCVRAVEDTTARWGHVDVLVNNAGYGVAGAIEELSPGEYMPMFNVNVFGLLNVTRAFLPTMRGRRAGVVMNLSSIGGLIGSAGWGYYNATKFAVEGLSQALDAELSPLGLHVVVVEPGPFRTEFLGDSGEEAKEQIADYRETAGKTREYFRTQNGKQPGDPQKAVEAMVAAATAAEPPKHLLLGKLAYQRWEKRLDDWRQELAAWKDTTLGADYADGNTMTAQPYK